jgi:hypothetical protein
MQCAGDFLSPFHVPGSHINVSAFLGAFFYDGKAYATGGGGYQNDLIL